jgi:hypothetical protein
MMKWEKCEHISCLFKIILLQLPGQTEKTAKNLSDESQLPDCGSQECQFSIMFICIIILNLHFSIKQCTTLGRHAEGFEAEHPELSVT